MKKIQIRRLLEDDLESVAELYRQFWNEESDIEKMKNKFNELKDNRMYLFLCGTIDEIVAGTITGIVCDELYGECRPFLLIENLVVDKKYRKSGTGKALMAAVEKYAEEWRCTQILFVTETDRKDAISFYESSGYNSKTHIGFKRSLE